MSAASELFDVPGVGLTIPDLKLQHVSGRSVYVELLGFWSRDAVWKRVEWAEQRGQGDDARFLFAVSSRLRVSEQVLSDETGASLYVFKGTPSAAGILKAAKALVE